MSERVRFSERVAFRIFPRSGCPEQCCRDSAGETKDLSENGASLLTDADVPKGAEMQVRIVSTNPPWVFTFRGVVAWSRTSGADGRWRSGIEFKWASESQRREWQDTIRRIRDRTALLPARAA